MSMNSFESQPQKINKLSAIFEEKRKELDELKRHVTLKELKAKVEIHHRTFRNFLGALENNPNMSLIAEIKKASPSHGDINLGVDIKEQAKKYEAAGANAISVLTDYKHFKGDLDFIKEIREASSLPVLRKDFIFDEYQIYESRLADADAILLIASFLDEKTLIELVELTHKLKMQCLIETHTKADIEKVLKTNAKIIGINARNLESEKMEVNLDTVAKLAKEIPEDRLIVAESGIRSKADVVLLAKARARVILVGTTLMTTKDIGAKVRELAIKI